MMKGGGEMAYVKPRVVSFSKEDVRNNILASATCQNAYCPKGDSYTCGTTHDFISSIPDEII